MVMLDSDKNLSVVFCVRNNGLLAIIFFKIIVIVKIIVINAKAIITLTYMTGAGIKCGKRYTNSQELTVASVTRMANN